MEDYEDYEDYEFYEYSIKKDFRGYSYPSFDEVITNEPENLTKYIKYDIFGNIIYELSIDISKLSKSKLKRLKELTKGSVI